MQDAYNLGWKVASVVLGVADPSILDTYQQERSPIAERLLSFDKNLYQHICSTSNRSDPYELGNVLEQENTSQSGLSVTYQINCLVTGTDSTQRGRCAGLASNLIVGGRLMDGLLVRHSDALSCNILSLLCGHGQWYILVFGANITDPVQESRLKHLSDFLWKRLLGTPSLNSSKEIRFGTFDIYLVYSTERQNIEFFDLPPIFYLFNEINGYDYGKVYADNVSYNGRGGHLHGQYGVSEQGCVVIVRPDQHVSFIGNPEDLESIDWFLSQFAKQAASRLCNHTCMI
ncbi:FAD-dependent monooxygenase terD [Metarhizium brunneum]|uniref:FAD-dependent monooxygenase terD n=1 Tax=Metarhizium brunneum TaxID=500148 RepID=A0A7D5UY87_9HYPO|nr:FAD-dependent monooxygenase terD [Metarhizium brunneum]